MTRVSTAIASAALALSNGANAAAPADAVVGRWLTESRHGVVDIGRCGESICGRLIDSDNIRANPGMRDDHDKDPAQRQRLLKGLLMLQGFHANGARWEDGTVYNPEDGGTYHGTITVVDNATLKVRGCIVWPLCKSQTWKRIG